LGRMTAQQDGRSRVLTMDFNKTFSRRWFEIALFSQANLWGKFRFDEEYAFHKDAEDSALAMIGRLWDLAERSGRSHAAYFYELGDMLAALPFSDAEEQEKRALLHWAFVGDGADNPAPPGLRDDADMAV